MEEKKILDINTVNDYVDFIGAPRQHPHINVVDLSGLQSIPRSRDHYHIYGLLMLDNADRTLTHDINRSSEGGGTLMFSAPGCLTGIDNGSNVKLNGWLLLFDPTLILDYCQGFYNRQFKQDNTSHSVHRRLRQVLDNYYEHGLQFKQGVPNVCYCAGELCLSANYLGDLMKQTRGKNAVTAIHEYVMERAKVLLATDKSVSHVAYDLGFDYPQHFIRLFKKSFQLTPAAYRRSLSSPQTTDEGTESDTENIDYQP